MISINNLSYYLGDRALYDEASLFITPKDKIGLIGLNGTGKSTLLKMIVGDVPPSEGEVSKSKETSIGFLNQDLLSYQSDEPILEVAIDEVRLDFQEMVQAMSGRVTTVITIEKIFGNTIPTQINGQSW